jgi:ATP-dependent DNA helicase PIF1
MNPEQEAAFRAFTQRKNLFISGPAGTGKTYLIRKMYKYCKDRGLTVHCTALTGCAALLLKDCKARTLHSFAGLGINATRQNIQSKVDNLRTNPMYKNIFWRWRKTRVLIVDEVSMLDPTFFECIDIAAKLIRGNERPMGGIQTIFLGDFFQLPCVSPGLNQEEKFCFDSPLWEEMFGENTIILTKNMRAANDIVLASMLERIRVGKIPSNFLPVLQQRVITEEEIHNMEVKPVQIVPTKMMASRINRREIQKLDGKTYTFTPGMVNPGKLNKTQMKREVARIEKNANYIVSLELKVGANVMLIQNISVEDGLVNGSMGVITGIYQKSPLYPADIINVKFSNGIETHIKRHTWMNDNNTFGITQIPLIPAYAITIHKIQGQTLDKVCANVGEGIFECGQSYVALSRVRSLNNLYLTNFEPASIFANDKVKQFYKN